MAAPASCSATTRRPTCASYRDEADAGVARVTAVWGPGWSSPVVLLAARHEPPSSPRCWAARGDKGLDQVAAVTVGLDPRRHQRRRRPGRDQPPDASATSSRSGRRVVITHELTHVAVAVLDHPRRTALALRGHGGLRRLLSASDLPRARVAAPLLDRSAPARRPGGCRPTPTSTRARAQIAPAYAAAWLACCGWPTATVRTGSWPSTGPRPERRPQRPGGRATERGAPPPSRRRRAPSAGVDAATSAAFRSVLGTTEPAFVSSWWAYATSLARS